MSDPRLFYPEPEYTGDTGLTNATLRGADAEPDIRHPSGGAVHFLATHASTDGQFGLYRWEMAAVQAGPAPHFHRTISESFFVLNGTISLYDGREWIDGRPGDFLFVPEGGIHAFRNESDAPASMLILFAPGATREEYFETTARFAAGLALSEEEKAAFYRRHDTYWV